MAYVSVGNVENIEDAMAGLQATYDSMTTVCQTQIIAAESKLDEARQEAEHSNQLLNTATESEQEAEQRLDITQNQFETAQEQLNDAYSSLSVCQASGKHDENGNYEPPDCSCEEVDVSEAEAALSEAETEVESSMEALNAAKKHRMQMERRNEIARKCLDMATNLVEVVKLECATRGVRVSSLIDTGKSRLASAKTALNDYLATTPSAAEFYSWLKWAPNGGGTITPGDLHARLNMSAEQQRYFTEYLAERDPIFRLRIAEYRRQYETANGTAEKLAVQLKIRKNLSGYLGEKIVEQALAPLGRMANTQVRTAFDDGTYTKTDIVIENLIVPVIIGRGEGMSAPVGGSIAIEVKCGRPAYLFSQKDHMVFQASGHRQANVSMTMCSRDIKNLAKEKEDELREALRHSGSPLIGMLPSKDDIDKACWDAVTESSVHRRGDYEN